MKTIGSRKNGAQWVQLRRRLLEQIKRRVELLHGELPADLKLYQESFEKEFTGHWQVSSMDHLIEELSLCSVVFGSDFHAFSQSQRTHLRLLRNINDRQVIIGLEAVKAEHQRFLDQWLRGEITAEEFAETTQWEEHWGYPLSHYQVFIELARAKEWNVIALDHSARESDSVSLTERDLFVAQQVVEAHEAHPHRLIYVIFGEMHLSMNHLPAQVLGLKPTLAHNMAVVYQNSEKLYFNLAEKKLEHQADVLKGASQRQVKRFCVMTSPPWVQWQSYLLMLENSYDIDLEDDLEDEFEDEDDNMIVTDMTDHVFHLLHFLAADLKVKVNTDDIAVVTAGDELFADFLMSKLGFKKQQVVNYLIGSDRSFVAPELGVAYLSRMTLNHASGLAGQYLHAKMSGRSSMVGDMPLHLESQIWIEAVGYFMSKLINHKRKTESIIELRSRLRASQGNGKEEDPLKLALEKRWVEMITIKTGRTRPLRYRPRSNSHYYEAAKILGHLLGERLYSCYAKNQISLETLKKYLRKDVFAADFSDFYLQVIKRLERQTNQTMEVNFGKMVYR